MPERPPNAPPAGFSLLELLVALAILAIIVTLAVPLYSDYSRRAYRAEAQSDLLACALGMERRATIEFTYAGAADSDADGTGDTDFGPVAGVICKPRSVAQGRYAVSVSGSVETFLLTARPATAGPMAADGFLTLDATGNRRWDRDNNGTIGVNEDRWD